MVKITIDKGFWQDGRVQVTLYHEDCPNPNCISSPLHYPCYLVAPYCPECKADLLGAQLVGRSAGRIEYHLEA